MQIKPYVESVVKRLTKRTRTTIDDNISVKVDPSEFAASMLPRGQGTLFINPQQMAALNRIPGAVPVIVAHEITHFLKDNTTLPNRFLLGEAQFEQFGIKMQEGMASLSHFQQREVVSDIMGIRLAEKANFPNAREGFYKVLNNFGMINHDRLRVTYRESSHPGILDRITLLRKNLADKEVVEKIDAYLDS